MSIESISSSGAVASNMREAIAVARGVAAPIEDTAGTVAPANAASVAGAEKGGAQAPTREQIDSALRQLHEAMPYEARNLLFSVDHDTGTTVVRVVDATTKELIVQIPSKELLALTKSLDKLAGLFVKDQV
jgi:flagellar protein FlaG